MKGKTTKLLGDNTREYLHDLSVRKHLLNRIQKTWQRMVIWNVLKLLLSMRRHH